MDKKETGQVLKTTTIFGGAQVIIVLSGLAKSKIIALLIGPAGVGISTLYNNILTMLSGIIGLGIGLSAIREIAKEEDIEKRIRNCIINKTTNFTFICCGISDNVFIVKIVVRNSIRKLPVYIRLLYYCFGCCFYYFYNRD